MPAAREGMAERTAASFSGSGREGSTTARMIPAMSGLARPELLATTAPLAENPARSAIRTLDLRWRPDGSGPAVHAAGHIPGAVLVDWRRELVEDGPDGETIVLAGPDRVAEFAARSGISDGTTVVVYDDTQALFASRAWWTLSAFGFDAVRVVDGGYPDWGAEGREVANARVPAATMWFTLSGPSWSRLTTSDVRCLLGSPGLRLTYSSAMS